MIWKITHVELDSGQNEIILEDWRREKGKVQYQRISSWLA